MAFYSGYGRYNEYDDYDWETAPTPFNSYYGNYTPPAIKPRKDWNKINKETGVENPESEWIVRDGEYEPIISEELFDAANERLKIESRNLGKRPASTYKSWISGTVHCSNCGRVLGWSPYKKKDGTRVGAFQCWGYTKGLCKTSCFA